MCSKTLLVTQILVVLFMTENATDVIYESEFSTMEISNSDLLGFWCDMPDISEGNHETYKFFDDGFFDYRNPDDILYSGNWNTADGILKLTFTKQDQTALTSQNYSIEYADPDNNAGKASIILEDKKFWNIPEPQDIINGIPLYIKYEHDYFKDKLNEGKEEHALNEETDDSKDRIIISYDGISRNGMMALCPSEKQIFSGFPGIEVIERRSESFETISLPFSVEELSVQVIFLQSLK